MQMEVGIKNRKERVITEDQLACSVGSGDVDVFATPMMIALVEACASESVSAALEPGQTTVGIRIDMTHEAATGLNQKVFAETELVDVSPNGRTLIFQVEAYDEVGLIGRGIHKRTVVWKERFEKRADERAKTAAGSNP